MSKGAAIISANYLADGEPVWWTGEGWSTQLSAVVSMPFAEAEALAATLMVRDAVLVVAIEVSPLTKSGEIPRRQIMRARGPKVRPDLTHEAA